MKHILNNLSEEEKNAIREQHTGGMKVMTENFSKLINSKLGDSKPLVNEQPETNSTDIIKKRIGSFFDKMKNSSRYTQFKGSPKQNGFNDSGLSVTGLNKLIGGFQVGDEGYFAFYKHSKPSAPYKAGDKVVFLDKRLTLKEPKVHTSDGNIYLIANDKIYNNLLKSL
jgi:hypothetical protein